MELGNKIAQCRKSAGISQEALAEQLRVSRQAVSRWETGETVPDLENLRGICRLFGVSADYLLFDAAETDGGNSGEVATGLSAKARFRVVLSGFLLGGGALMVLAALLLAWLETGHPYPEPWYPELGKFASYLLRTWRCGVFATGWVLAAVGSFFLYREYHKL